MSNVLSGVFDGTVPAVVDQAARNDVRATPLRAQARSETEHAFVQTQSADLAGR